MSDLTVTIELPAPVYTLLSSSLDGLPAIVVVNEALVPFPYRDVFPWELSVEIFARAIAGNGMPTAAETELLDRVGDAIDAVVLDGRNALFFARITHDATRRLLYRVHDPELADASLRDLASKPEPLREWEYVMVADPTWERAEPLIALVMDARAEG